MLWEILWRNKNSFSLTFCILFSTVCMIWQRNPLARTVGFFGKVADRASGAMNSGLSATGRFWVEIDKFRELEKRYAQAEKQIEEYKLEKDKFDALKKENDTLRKTLGFAIPAEFPEVRAEVLGVRLNSISPRVIIGKGEETGIRPFMPVIARSHDADNNTIRSVVGIVVSADNGTSVVQPLIHPGFQLGVRLPDSGAWAMLSGNSGNPTQALLTVISGDGSLDGKKPIGQVVVTSGDGGVFPKGIPVGTIVKEGPRQGQARTFFVKPFAQLMQLDSVTVVIKKPAAWARKNDEDKLEEFLKTEFGAPEYPETLMRLDSGRDRGPKQTQDPGEQTTGTDQQPATPGQQNEPRRIQNVNPQTR